MVVERLTARLKDQIAGAPACWDRVLIVGTPPWICRAEGITSYLYAGQVRIFDYPKFAGPFRDRLRENAGRLAATKRGVGFAHRAPPLHSLAKAKQVRPGRRRT
jgi:hypothetical protein